MITTTSRSCQTSSRAQRFSVSFGRTERGKHRIGKHEIFFHECRPDQQHISQAAFPRRFLARVLVHGAGRPRHHGRLLFARPGGGERDERAAGGHRGMNSAWNWYYGVFSVTLLLGNIKEEGEAVLMLGLKEEESTGDGRYVYTHTRHTYVYI